MTKKKSNPQVAAPQNSGLLTGYNGETTKWAQAKAQRIGLRKVTVQ
jgi:hypothetical protein